MLIKEAEPKKKKLYSRPEQLLKAWEESKVLGKPTDELLKHFTLIAKNSIQIFGSYNKSDNDACINYAIAEAYFKWDKFDPKKSDNIFSCFTTIILNDMRFHYGQLTKGRKTHISIESLFSNNSAN